MLHLNVWIDSWRIARRNRKVRRLARQSLRRRRRDILGPIEALEDRIVLNAAPTVDVLSHLGDGLIGGYVQNDGSVANLTVEIDYDGDGFVDTTAITNSDGYFETNLCGTIPFNEEATVYARATEVVDGETVYGGWTSVTFTIDNDPPAIDVLSHLGDGLVAGYVMDDGPLQGITVEIDYDGDGAFDVSTTTNSDGYFEIDLSSYLQDGEVTIEAHALQSACGITLVGDSQFLTFTYGEEVGDPETSESPSPGPGPGSP